MSVFRKIQDGKWTDASMLFEDRMNELAGAMIDGEDQLDEMFGRKRAKKTAKLKKSFQFHNDEANRAERSGDKVMTRVNDMLARRAHDRMSEDYELVSDFADMLAEDYGLEDLTMEDVEAILDEVLERMKDD